MAKLPYHDVLGGYFMTHPPIREMNVDVSDHNHPLTYNRPIRSFARTSPT